MKVMASDQNSRVILSLRLSIAIELIIQLQATSEKIPSPQQQRLLDLSVAPQLK